MHLVSEALADDNVEIRIDARTDIKITYNRPDILVINKKKL